MSGVQVLGKNLINALVPGVGPGRLMDGRSHRATRPKQPGGMPMDGRDVSFDDALYMGQTEMGHIGPKVDRPIFLCAVKAKRQDGNDGNRWSIVHSTDSGDPQYR